MNMDVLITLDKIVIEFFYAASGITADHDINQNADADRYGKEIHSWLIRKINCVFTNVR